MFAVKICLVYLGLIAVQSAHGNRFGRSPDKMEIDIPNRERDSTEYQEEINKEAEYWHGQGQDKENEGHGQLEEDREKNEELYQHVAEHHHENQQTYNKEMNQTYQSDKENLVSHHQANQDHYQEHHDNGFETQTVPALTGTETGDRYEDKGNEFKEEGENAMYNYEPGQHNPTITYTRD